MSSREATFSSWTRNRVVCTCSTCVIAKSHSTLERRKGLCDQRNAYDVLVNRGRTHCKTQLSLFLSP